VVRGLVEALPGNYYSLFDGLHKAITEDKQEPVTADDGIKVMKIIEAAMESSAQKRVVEL
jgi:scyllo-inositol 2-dehydrogenase (NADP+)